VVAYDFNHLNRLNNAAAKFQAKSKIHWPFIKMTMEFRSSRHSFDHRLRQAHSYVAHLLAARPDLDLTLGLLIEKDCMVIFICASSGTKMVKVEKADCLTVLAAVRGHLHLNP